MNPPRNRKLRELTPSSSLEKRVALDLRVQKVENGPEI